MTIRVMVIGDDADTWIEDAKRYQPDAAFVNVTAPEELTWEKEDEPVIVLRPNWEHTPLAKEDDDGALPIGDAAAKVLVRLVNKHINAVPFPRRPQMRKVLVAVADREWRVWKNTAMVDVKLDEARRRRG